MILDGTDCVFGRLASVVAKGLLRSEPITVVNVRNIIRKGNLDQILEEYHARQRPQRPRNVLFMFRETIRGMLPGGSARGRRALRMLRCYSDCPPQFAQSAKVQLFMFRGRRITLDQIVNSLK